MFAGIICFLRGLTDEKRTQKLPVPFLAVADRTGLEKSADLLAAVGDAGVMARIRKYKKHLIALAALVLALVCLFKPEYAENVARAFMLLIAGV